MPGLSLSDVLARNYRTVSVAQLFAMFKDVDFSVFKQFGVTEQSRLQFRAAFFTLTNTSSFNASV